MVVLETIRLDKQTCTKSFYDRGMKSWRRGGGGVDHMQLTNIDKYIKANVKLNKTLKILYASMSAITVLFLIHWQIYKCEG